MMMDVHFGVYCIIIYKIVLHQDIVQYVIMDSFQRSN